ncbi:MAG: alpha/beta hydrolase [Planctomycetes bacterium]|nr:alpha/beta hydrolase [Planctomycetota bacterium]
MALRVRNHGTDGPLVFVLHGGPGAPGSAEGLARALAAGFTVREPFQARSGPEPLTVRRHVDDLLELLPADRAPALVGHSWGAMLALATAAAAPARIGAIALVGCGTFDARARRELDRRLARRIDVRLRAALDRARAEIAEPDARLRREAELLSVVHAHDPLSPPAPGDVDARGHGETWRDMLRLQRAGVYPRAFAAIRAPVLMLHGTEDPHPGALIRDGLRRFLPRLEYHALPHCGHEPWNERLAREPFLATLRDWLRRHAH